MGRGTSVPRLFFAGTQKSALGNCFFFAIFATNPNTNRYDEKNTFVFRVGSPVCQWQPPVCNLEPRVSENDTVSLTWGLLKGVKELRSAEVVNMLGQHATSVSGTSDELQIDMAGLPSGVYFIEIADAEGKRCLKKVMKE